MISTFCLPGHLSVPLPQLFFYWLLLVYCSSLFCLFFSSSRSFMNTSYICFIFSPRFWIIYTTIILNSFPGRLPSSTPFSYFSGVLSCSFIWEIILCLFISVNFCDCGFHSGGFGDYSSSCFLLPSGEWGWWEGLVVGKTGSYSCGLGKTLIQLSADGRGGASISAWGNPALWRRQWHPTPVLLPGKSHGWRSLVGCSPWGR